MDYNYDASTYQQCENYESCTTVNGTESCETRQRCWTVTRDDGYMKEFCKEVCRKKETKYANVSYGIDLYTVSYQIKDEVRYGCACAAHDSNRTRTREGGHKFSHFDDGTIRLPLWSCYDNTKIL